MSLPQRTALGPARGRGPFPSVLGAFEGIHRLWKPTQKIRKKRQAHTKVTLWTMGEMTEPESPRDTGDATLP